ncbi:MAG: carbohydrate kinase [Phycisphaerales bacterium]|nr:MAG: carbohydrate kinase [Phycisphaerales bacterium]
MEKRMIAGLGELLWDCFGHGRSPGGAPANVAYHAGQLGMTGRVVSRVGLDPDGDALLIELTRRGLSTQAIQRDPDHATGRVTVDTSRADKPVYTIHPDAAWDHIEWNDALSAGLDGAAAICFGTLAQRSPASRATIQRVLDTYTAALRVYDVNLRPPWYTRDVIEASLERCDVVKLNHEEAPVVAELVGLDPAGEPDACARALRQWFDLRLVCVTRGERGCLAVSAEQTAEARGVKVDVADTVGAGDAFTAALVCGLLQQWPLEDVLHFANDVGGLVAGRRGAMPELREELKGLGVRD